MSSCQTLLDQSFVSLIKNCYRACGQSDCMLFFGKDWNNQSISTVFLGHLPPQHASAENATDCLCVIVGLFVQNVQFTVTCTGTE